MDKINKIIKSVSKRLHREIPLQAPSIAKDLSTAESFDSHYQVLDKLGEGWSGAVYSARSKDAGQDLVVVKFFGRDKTQYWAKEMSAMKILQGYHCENIIEIKKGARTSEGSWIVMEAGGLDMMTAIESMGVSDEYVVLEFFRQMVNGVITVHKAGICHHDIKLDNFVVGLDGKIKLIDFGLSLILAEDQEVNKDGTIKGKYSAGSAAYTPLEVLKYMNHCPQKTDLFSLGVCLYRMLCGRFPFCEINKDSMDDLIRNQMSGRFALPQHLSPEAKELLKGLLDTRQEQRWGWSQVMAHPWISASN
eukprot:TRINITY_DN113_c0_g1_i1.p1 TRINITY_DN113_c0_g1~~TRINITY_DN113_c0_g1_i1.p1  ORF type:complete len:315 (-),score=108.43 TRINITY_DN113_c0_g1_i1:36-950(-)